MEGCRRLRGTVVINIEVVFTGKHGWWGEKKIKSWGRMYGDFVIGGSGH